MMEIQKFFHDPDPLKNRELFGLLGEYGLSQRVRGALGGLLRQNRDDAGSS